MTEEATKKRSRVAKKSSHPKYIDMVQGAIRSLKETKGSSRHAIVKYIMSNYKVGDNDKHINTRVKMALKAGSTKGVLKHVKGVGASGSFRLAVKKAPVEDSPKKTVVKKPVASKASPKKSAAKKSPKKSVAKKPAAAKKSPKKAASKKSTPKKTPVKKITKKVTKKVTKKAKSPTKKKAAKK